MRVTVCGKQYEIVESRSEENGVYTTRFSVDINGVTRTLGAEYRKVTAGNLLENHNIVLDDDLRDILETEVRLEIFAEVNNTTLSDITSGKHPALIPLWVKDFGVEDLLPEVQEQYIDAIADALQGKI